MMPRRLWSIFAALAILLSGTQLLRGDSLSTVDTLQRGGLGPALFSDSLMLADSLAGGHTHWQRWIYPLGLIVVTVTAIYLLFSTRSK
jgi:hypothetical protein